MKSELNKLIDLFLDFGVLMMKCGGEINRVEDTLSRLGTSYGADKMNVFVITSFIVITARFGECEITHSRRVKNGESTDFQKLDKLNSLSRECSETVLSLDEFESRLSEIKNMKSSSAKLYIGSALASGAFAMFFGGSIIDGIVAGLFGILICFLQKTLSALCPNKVFFYFLCSVMIGFAICTASILVPVLQSDRIMIGDIMLLIPGLAITNAIRDIIIGDTVSGIIKLAQCLLWAGTLAGGFMLSISIIGGVI